MTQILLAVGIVSGTGLVAGLVLSLAGTLLREPEDRRLQQLGGAMPGYNCGACGYPGCAGYAEAVYKGEADCNLCRPGRAAVAEALVAIMEAK